MKVVQPNGDIDLVITKDQIDELNISCEALVIRTIPNSEEKCHKNYSSTNPTYFEASVANRLIEAGVEHLLVDLPSVDRESDGGVLAFHHEFWEVPKNPNFKRTITELIFVDNTIQDGMYVLNLQVSPFQNDAAPSRPLLFEISQI
jgi:kynurenine formamidase